MASELLQAALYYAELGYRVFPCAPGAKAPVTEHGFHDATTDATQIEAWWTNRPSANVAIATQGLMVIDVDGPPNAWLADDPDKLLSLAVAPLATTPRGGRHYVFRQPSGACWRSTEGQLAPHVDTRGDGGYILAAPSIVAGSAYRWAPEMELDVGPAQLSEPPAWLAQLLAASSPTARRAAAAPAEGNAIPQGQRNATLARLAGAMRRVGMSQSEIAAALTHANAERCMPPVPQREVDRIAASVARYEPDQVAVALVENHWVQMYAEQAEEGPPEATDPGPTPESLLRVPGFVSQLMDHCLATAPYPNVALAFGGALVLLAFLAGRKIRDPGDNRTNLYLLGLAHSGAGKDWPRKLNTEIAHQVGLGQALGERFASGEGLQDSLFATPCMLFQTDEIDGLLQSINNSRDHRHESIMGTLLTMFSSAGSVYPMRRKAGRDSPGAIVQPCLTMFGTAIPNHYYAALSERMLTNGLFARMLILESARRGAGQEPVIRAIPDQILETAAWWAAYQPSAGNLQGSHPSPRIVAQSDEARRILVDARLAAEIEYQRCEADGDPVGTTVWGRVSEQSRKLALLYAASANHLDPQIDQGAAQWAVDLVLHQTRRMLFMASLHVSESEFDQRCKRIVDALAAWRSEHGDGWMPYRDLSRRFRWSRREHDEVREALIDQERIETDTVSTGGRPRLVYRLRTPGAGRAT